MSDATRVYLRMFWGFFALAAVCVGSLIGWNSAHAVPIANCDNTIYFAKSIAQCDALVNAENQMDLKAGLPGLFGVLGSAVTGAAWIILKVNEY